MKAKSVHLSIVVCSPEYQGLVEATVTPERACQHTQVTEVNEATLHAFTLALIQMASEAGLLCEGVHLLAGLIAEN